MHFQLSVEIQKIVHVVLKLELTHLCLLSVTNSFKNDFQENNETAAVTGQEGLDLKFKIGENVTVSNIKKRFQKLESLVFSTAFYCTTTISIFDEFHFKSKEFNVS